MKNIIALVNLLYKFILITALFAIAIWPLIVPLSMVTNMVFIPSLLLGLFGIAIYLSQKIETWRAAYANEKQHDRSNTNRKCIISGCPIFH